MIGDCNGTNTPRQFFLSSVLNGFPRRLGGLLCLIEPAKANPLTAELTFCRVLSRPSTPLLINNGPFVHNLGHASYWYRQQSQTRRREYLGARLDPMLVLHVAQRAIYAGAITAHVAQLAYDQELLASLLTGRAPLGLADRHRLEQLGYGHILPPPE